MTRGGATTLLLLAILMCAAGAFIYLFAESWWRLIGLLLFSFAAPLVVWARRSLRRPRGPGPFSMTIRSP